MRKLGYILLMSGLVCMTFFVLGAGYSPRKTLSHDNQSDSAQKPYTGEDVALGIGKAGGEVADILAAVHIGGLLVLAAGLISRKPARRDLSAKKRPRL
jgi:hypothetical protein